MTGGVTDGDLERLRAGARDWAALAVDAKITVLRECRASAANCAARWTAAAAAVKGVAGTDLEGEESITGPWAVLAMLNAYIRTLGEIRDGGEPRAVAANGRPEAVDVFPASLFDRLLLLGTRAQVRLESPAPEFVKPGPPRLSLVLGAGNITSIGPLDVLYKVVVEGRACLLKVHPLLEPLTPELQTALAPLVERDLLRFAHGGAAEAAALVSSPLVDEIHITGSAATYRVLVDEARGKPITSELGNVSPVIVMPGEWTRREIAHVAEQIVSAKLHNDGYNCIAPQVLILPAAWPQRASLLAAIERLLESCPARPAYYPGSVARYDNLVAGRAAARIFGETGATQIPPTLVDVDPDDAGEPLFCEEAFCALLAVAALPGEPAAYLRAATTFCNERLAGDLAANLFVDRRTMREYAGEVEAALAGLRYGCIGVNVWSGVGFLLPPLPWGGYPKSANEPVGSGIGVVHNSHFLARTQKSLIFAPFAPLLRRPKPPWFVTQRNRARIGRELCRYEATGSPLAIARLSWYALTG